MFFGNRFSGFKPGVIPEHNQLTRARQAARRAAPFLI